MGSVQTVFLYWMQIIQVLSQHFFSSWGLVIQRTQSLQLKLRCKRVEQVALFHNHKLFFSIQDYQCNDSFNLLSVYCHFICLFTDRASLQCGNLHGNITDAVNLDLFVSLLPRLTSHSGPTINWDRLTVPLTPSLHSFKMTFMSLQN